MVETLQSRIMDDFNERMIGKTLEVLVDGYDEEFSQYYGRTYGDSPDIDGRVWLSADEDLREGSFVRVCIDGLIEGDLAGYVLEDSQ
jgi:ribosomal protein S12 methylthiotransferase